MKKGLHFAFLVFTTCAYSQTTFDKVVHQQTNMGVLANDTYLKTNGELFISGNMDFNASHLTKIDSLGEPIWSKTYPLNDQNNPMSYQFHRDDIIQLQDINYLLTRNVYDGTNYLTFLVKFDENGNAIWSNKVHKNNASNLLNGLTIQLGNSEIIHLNAVANSTSLELIRLTSSGVVISNYAYQNTNSMRPIALINDSNSVYIVASNLSSNETHILKCDFAGNMTSALEMDNFAASDAVIYQSKIHLIGRDINFGGTFATVDFDSSLVHFQYGLPFDQAKMKNYDSVIYVLNYNSTFGELLTYHTNNNQWEQTFIFSGIIDYHKHSSNRSYIVGNGPTIGLKAMFEPQIGLSLFDPLNNASMCVSTPFIIAPQSTASVNLTASSFINSSIQPFDFENYNLNWVDADLFTEIGCVASLGSLSENDLDVTVTLSPNPTNEDFVVKSEEYLFAKIEILSTDGHLIQEENMAGINHRISGSELQSGIYFVRLILDNGKTTTKKLILQK